MRFYLTGVVLVSHLRMEGRVSFYPDTVPERKHAHVFFRRMTDGGTLFMRMSTGSLGPWMKTDCTKNEPRLAVP